jgi:flagellar motor switch protein FliN/FliY
MTTQLTAAIAEELAIVLGALLDTPVVTSPSDEHPSGRHWVAVVKTDHVAHGTAMLRFDEVGAAAVTSLIMGLTEAAPEAAISDTLREAVAQALGAVSLQDVAKRATLKLASLEIVEPPDEIESADAYTLTAAGLAVPLTVAIGGTMNLDAAVPAAASSDAPQDDDASEASPADRIDVILDIDLPLIVRFGRTELPLKTLARMGPGSLIDLGRSADDPVDVLVSNRVVARGEVVIVGGNYGVRILDVVSPKERVRSMEA